MAIQVTLTDETQDFLNIGQTFREGQETKERDGLAGPKD
jgi:hypothetical protein